jgi:hypothetical protein
MIIGKKCMSIKSKSKKAPSLGDKIEHTCRLNGKFEGKVIELLAMQFIYETKEGHHRHCLFREDWKYKTK